MTFILMIIILGIMVIVHETGHFLAAKAFKISVPIYSIGFGKRLFGKKIGKTDYRVSILPFGGYVKLKGMDIDEFKNEEDDFLSKSIIKRIIVIISGPIANFILAFLIMYFVIFTFGVKFIDNNPIKEAKYQASFLNSGDKILKINNNTVENFTDIFSFIKWNENNVFVVNREDSIISISAKISNPDSFYIIPIINPIIGRVIKDSPAFKAGLKTEDRIVKIDSIEIYDWYQISDYLKDKYEKQVHFIIERNGKYIDKIIIPEKIEIMQDDTIAYYGKIGIEYITKTLKPNMIETFYLTNNRIKFIISSIINFIVNIFKSKVSMKMMGGPVAIYSLIGENLKWGIDALLLFVSFFSLNLFIFNLIPFPPLDGSYIVLYLIEGIFKKRPSKRFMIIYQQIGFFILIFLILLVTYNDILRLFSK